MSIEDLRSPIVIAAFEGWNDAGEAASATVSHLGRVLGAETAGWIDPDDYYDFQVNRPIGRGDYLADVQIIWPTTRFSAATVPGANVDLLLVHGIEPNMRWQAFTAELMKSLQAAHASVVITVAALLADVPHTKPIRVTTTASDPETAARYGVEHARMQGEGGPVGISAVFAKAAVDAGLDSFLMWGSVPHYVAEPPSPKVTLALLHEIKNLLELEIPVSDLPESARIWERGVDELAAQDPEVLDYVRSLEAAL